MSSDKSVIRNCSLGYACICQWDALKKLKDDNIRFCNTCQKEVHDCSSIEDLAESILLNRSVHIGELVFDEVENTSAPHFDTSSEQTQGYSQRTQPKIPPMAEPDFDFDDDIPF